MGEMLAISLWQPWGSLLFTSPRTKLHETRSWEPPTRARGRRIAVHVAKKVVKDEEIDGELDALCIEHLGGVAWQEKVPRGALIGFATLATARRVEMPASMMGATPDDELTGDWTPGRWVWRMDDPVLLPRPVPWKGMQNFFAVPSEAEIRALAR